ncbi:MAG: hypothetical protein AAF614_13415 [Chloroflexota bacterium]
MLLQSVVSKLRGKRPFLFLIIIIAVLLLLTLNVVAFSLIIMTTSERLAIQYIPDDAFYYLTLAKNFSQSGSWTFDSGNSVTTGFHPLFAYLLAGTYLLLTPDTAAFLTQGLAISLLFTLGAIIIMGFWGFRRRNPLFLMFLLLVISSPNFVYNTVSVTEWSLTLFIAASYFVWFIAKYDEPNIKTWDFGRLFMLGLLGSLARADFGLFPFAIAITTLLIFRTATLSKKTVLLAVAGLSGAVIGLLILFGHNFLFAGEFLQSSAQMKGYWAQIFGPDYYLAPLLLGHLIGLNGLLVLTFLLLYVLVPRFLKRTAPQQQAGQTDLLLPFLAAVLTLGGYIVFYGHNGAVQPWYTATLIVPLMMLIFVVSRVILEALDTKMLSALSLVFVVLAVFNVSRLYPIHSSIAPWPHQQIMLESALYLKKHMVGEKIGAWNAGIIGYYATTPIVNLDGLVNNDIYNYAVSNELPRYIDEKGINYIVDFENMLVFPALRVRGGYDDAVFIARLKSVKQFDQGEYGWKHLTLYRVEEESATN